MLRLHASALNSRITTMADAPRVDDPAPDSGLDPRRDPRLVTLRRALEERPLTPLPRDASLSQAAVLLTLRPTDPLELLLIKRAEKEGDPWSGHMALPGGRRQTGDATLLATALRETREETGLVVDPAAVLGELEEVRPGSRRRFSIMVSPWVAVVDPRATITPAPAEVETALWVPLPHLASEEAVDELLIELEGESRAFPALSYQEYVIWGLTHRILEDFLGLARSVGLV
ncbi:MAG: CoA pyrophosphatase [Gemmatimonadetes bacterium]|nr:CoA pyrophosphatase [Gemmatimonadota bacterium]